MYFIYLLIAFFAGLGLATQAAINSQLAKSMGDEAIIAALISFAVGTLFLFVIAWWKTDLWQHLSALPQQPAWKFLGGILGAFAVFTTVLLAPKLGISVMLFFIIIGQLISSTTIDYFGLIGMPTLLRREMATLVKVLLSLKRIRRFGSLTQAVLFTSGHFFLKIYQLMLQTSYFTN